MRHIGAPFSYLWNAYFAKAHYREAKLLYAKGDQHWAAYKSRASRIGWDLLDKPGHQSSGYKHTKGSRPRQNAKVDARVQRPQLETEMAKLQKQVAQIRAFLANGKTPVATNKGEQQQSTPKQKQRDDVPENGHDQHAA